MKVDAENPIAGFFDEQMNHFYGECIRLRDKQPLKDYKALFEMLVSTQKKLGTLEHEVALAEVATQFKLTAAEAGDAWRKIWRRFRQRRKRTLATKRRISGYQRKAEETLPDMENTFGEMQEKNFEFTDQDLMVSLRETLDAFKEANIATRDLGVGWKRTAWLLLVVDIQIYAIYFRYYTAKLIFFLLRHGFIVLASVLICGILYSRASRLIIEGLSALFPKWPWLAAILTLVVPLIKKYYIDKKIKIMQVKLEARWLKPLVFRMHVLRTLALRFRTMEEMPKMA